ncbi:MAG: HDOD domain-containing protein [Thermodesulfobacteriota bacterium]
MTPRELVDGVSGLVSLPDVWLRISQLLDDPRADAAALGEVVAHDPALTSRLLRLVNSACYGLPSRVETVSRAVALVGNEELRHLVLSSAATGALQRLKPEGFDLDAFWHHSVHCALLVRALAARRQPRHRERGFVSGLLHDVGRLVLCHQAPGACRACAEPPPRTGAELLARERAALGFTHADVGGELLRSWGLPESLWEPVQFHHEPAAARSFPVDAALLHLGHAVAEVEEPGTGAVAAGSLKELELPARLWSQAGLSPGVLEEAVLEASGDWFDVIEVLRPGAGVIY